MGLSCSKVSLELLPVMMLWRRQYVNQTVDGYVLCSRGYLQGKELTKSQNITHGREQERLLGKCSQIFLETRREVS